MAGYLTHLMVLIKAEAWLGHLIAALERRRAAPGACLSDFEEAMLDLAQRSRSLLRVDPAAPEWARLATRIDNGVGTGLSKYALVGSIGMDFPINGHVLALNRDWVSRTMRIGSPRRAYVNADSTDFVLNFINALTDTTLGLDPLQQHAMRSYALGHLAGVAADVVLQPAVNSWTWSEQNSGHLDQHRFKVQLDARVAHGFFQRNNLHQGQEWEDYFLSSGDVERDSELTKVFLKAFRDTYGAARPTSGICAVAASECRVPEITEAFLKDAYANTKNWAIGRGYDQTPWCWYKSALGGFIFIGGMLGVLLVWSSTSTYNIEKWRQGKGFETERLWYDLIGTANTLGGAVYYPFTLVAKFPIRWSGIFGQGTIRAAERPTGKAFVSIFKGVYDLISLAFEVLMFFWGLADETSDFYTSVDPVKQEPYIRWSRFGLGTFLELFKTFWIDMGSAENGEEGDRLGFTMFWPVKIGTFATYFASVLIVFGAKSARKKDDVTEDKASGWDYLIGMICPVVFIAITWGTKLFEGKVMEEVVGARWPGTDTDAVGPFLPEATIAPFGNPSEGVAGHRRFTGEGATGFPVRLFEESNGGVVTEGGAPHYAEDANASPWGSVRQRDDAARKLKSTASSKSDYKMAELIDHAAHLAGLLAMAAVNYDGSSPRLRDSVKEIFKDWNLDYRTVAEWNALMEPSTTSRGLLSATAEWWDGLNQSRPNTDQAVIDRIEQDMAVTGFSGRILADFTHAGASPQSVVSPLPPNARCGRLKRPGAILLSNLNFDETITVPLPTPLPDRVTRLDAVKDNAIESVSDQMDLTEFSIARPTRAAAAAFEMELKLNPQDAARIRIFEVSPTDLAPAWPRRLGANAGGAAEDSYTIPTAATGDLNFSIEALTLPGDPLLTAPTIPPPVRGDGVTPVVSERKPGDVWMELRHSDGGTPLGSLRDVALFTIAPWLMFSNLQPTERLYIVYQKDYLDRDNILHANHSTVSDVIEAMEAAFGAARVPVQRLPVVGGGNEYVAHQPLPGGAPNAAETLYLINGSEYCNDQWIQDEIEIGYCWAPRAWTPMTIHVPRKRGLEGFVHKELPGADMALFNSLSNEWDSLNYGGNIEVSPPVERVTDAIASGQAGLAIPRQEAAPFGKIILGEGLFTIATTLDESIVGDLDAGGVISAAVRAELEAKGFAAIAIIANVTVLAAGSDWRIDFTGLPAGAPQLRIRLESGTLNVYELRVPGPDQQLFTLDPSLVADFDLGGAPSERIQNAFVRGFTLVISSISVITAGSEWILNFAGTPFVVSVRLESGRLNIYAPGASGPDRVFGMDSDPALVTDLDNGGAPSDRLNRALRLFLCQFKPLAIPLPVPQVTVRSAGNEWLITLAGRPARPLMLIRRESGHLSVFQARIIEPRFKAFLEAQAVQPILSFDTAWLHVGHVDEVCIFVPSNTPKGFKLLMSSTQLATDILNEANTATGPVTHLFRGKQRIEILSDGHRREIPAVTSVSDFLADHQAVNAEIQAERLTPIEQRLLAGLALDPTDVIHLPVYYDVQDMTPGSIGHGGLTSAKVPHMVNLQVIGRRTDAGDLERHVIVPRPFGPRMRPADAATVLTNAHIAGVSAARLTPWVGHWTWVRRGTRLAGADGLAATFTVTEAAIRSHANNAGKFTSAGAVKNNWDRIWIPEDNVDLFEACTQVLLEDIGITVHWVDEWDTYHRRFGEIHCGTNVVRTPREAVPNYSGPYWWDHYHP